MHPSVPFHGSVDASGPRPVFRVAGAALVLLALVCPRPAAGQDPVSGRWFATVEDVSGAARAVFVLEARGGLVRGRRILRGSGDLDVSGRRDGHRVRLEFEVPEGRSTVAVVIEAEAFQGRMTGTWTAVLPSGQRVVRSWHAERTRAGASSTRREGVAHGGTGGALDGRVRLPRRQ